MLGRVIQDTISGKIADLSAFAREPEMFAYGMMVALFVGGAWQIAASYFELNVSATHSIIGAIVGFSLVHGGGGAVHWAQKAPKKKGETRPFPPVTGVTPIVLSWFVSPVLTGLASALIFLLCRTLVLRRKNSYKLSFIILPAAVLLTVWVNIYFVLTKGAAKTLSTTGSWSKQKSGLVALGAAAGASLLTGAVVVPLLWFRIRNLGHAAEAKALSDKEAALAATTGEAEARQTAVELPEAPFESTTSPQSFQAQPPRTKLRRFLHWLLCMKNGAVHSIQRGAVAVNRAAMHGMEVDIFEIVEEDPIVAAIHKHAEVFDPKSEQVFSYLQVFSAICVIFAHGAGEVGYMTGPLGAIWQVVNTGVLGSKVSVPIWIVLLSAGGLVVGLATYGYNVTRAMGTRMAKLTPSRGFAAELATSLVILIASQYGLPTSSSQCITGGIIGVALCEGSAGLNWRFFLKTFGSWMATLVMVAAITALVYAQAVYAPSVPMAKQLLSYENGVAGAASTLLASYAAQLKASGYNTSSTTDTLAKDLAVTRANLALVQNGSLQTVKPFQTMGYLNTSLALFQPALTVNASSPAICPAITPSNACTLPPAAAQPPVTLTSYQYGVDTPTLDKKKQSTKTTCISEPCNAATIEEL